MVRARFIAILLVLPLLVIASAKSFGEVGKPSTKTPASQVKSPTDKFIAQFNRTTVSIIVIQDEDSDLITEMLPLREIEREIATRLIGSGYVITSGESTADITLEVYVNIKIKESFLSESSYNTYGRTLIRAKDKDGNLLAQVSDNSSTAGDDLIKTSLEALTNSGKGAAMKLRDELQQSKKKVIEETSREIEISFRNVPDFAKYQSIDDMLAKGVTGIEIQKRVFSSGGNISFFVSSRLNRDEIIQAIQGLMPQELALEPKSDDSHLLFMISAPKKQQ